jgi:UDP-N-acetylmuramoyl-L-alanyl-D-glutamate--2,6-diaminopimelate ligase
LDYHGTLEDYIDAKHLLFKKHNLAYAVINVDDEVGRKFIQTTKQNAGTASICYTMHEQNICSDNYIYIKNYEFVSGKNNGYNLNLAIKFNQQIIQDNLYISILGEFNLYNLMAVIGGLLSLGYTWQDIKNVLPVIKSVAGRLEIVNNSKNGSNSSKLVLVDYAHTPDALEKTLTTLKPIAIQRNGKLWCVFGCGGNRDRTKRPIMGSISQNNADISIITSDNPRFEEPAEIIKDILIGINTHSIINETVKIIEDRYDAINYAIEHMQEQDVLLIAGKGHETYQDIKGVKHDFSDVLVAEGVL